MAESTEPRSEILKVIEVQKKKQRINDNYLGIEDVDGLDDSDYDDEYGSEYDSEAEMRIEDLTGLSQNLLRLIVAPLNIQDEGAGEGHEQFADNLLKFLFQSIENQRPSAARN